QLKLVFTTGLCFLILLGITACQSNAEDEGRSSSSMDSTLTQTAATNDQSPEEKYALAKEAHNENPDDPDALIWFGRRAAYLGHYDEAIDIFTSGIKSHPEDARMYRHRGHRYISTRQYDKAIVDFEKAVTLIAGQADEVEPDGLPNSRNIPLSTLHGNIWYHLGLAFYLKNDMDNALRAFSNRTVTERYDDNIVSGGHWLFMILSRQGKTEEANEAISAVHPKMDIIENDSYYQMCLFYKNLIPESELIMDDPTSSSANVLNYGLGNWYLYQKQDTATAKKYYAQLLETGNKYAFAYLAAESDWERLFQED
ncbi:MAG: tetratricopeptide repeat protein, partial [Saprospiraceae bacterium]|nr:tetratricopeptide repeat protein [Saprospiraceae bacterium]